MGQPVVHFEIGCRDLGKTSEFYHELFGWSTEAAEGSALINTGSDDGIQGHIASLGHEPHNYINFYVQVDDLDAYLKNAEKLGGKTVIPPTPVQQMGMFAWLADPEGTVVGIWKPNTP